MYSYIAHSELIHPHSTDSWIRLREIIIAGPLVASIMDPIYDPSWVPPVTHDGLLRYPMIDQPQIYQNRLLSPLPKVIS
nr:MAG TPA: hypothetical protein [Caudoviricetes sp.]